MLNTQDVIEPVVVTRKTLLEERAGRVPFLCRLQKVERSYEERCLCAANYFGKWKSSEWRVVVHRVGFADWLLAGAGESGRSPKNSVYHGRRVVRVFQFKKIFDFYSSLSISYCNNNQRVH